MLRRDKPGTAQNVEIGDGDRNQMKKTTAKYEYVLFDLDGTLTDPALGITNSVMYALKKFGISVSDRSELFRFIGPPLMYSFKTYYGFDDEKAKLAIDYYRDRFADGGKFENEVYPGIAELLAELRSAGSRIILATSKPEEFSVEILEHFDLLKYFDFVAGNTLDEARPEKRQVIEHILNSVPDIRRTLRTAEGRPALETCGTVMVGDRCYDVTGAAEFGIPTVGVLFGYGTKAELEEAGAAETAASVSALRRLLLEQ